MTRPPARRCAYAARWCASNRATYGAVGTRLLESWLINTLAPMHNRPRRRESVTRSPKPNARLDTLRCGGNPSCVMKSSIGCTGRARRGRCLACWRLAYVRHGAEAYGGCAVGDATPLMRPTFNGGKPQERLAYVLRCWLEAARVDDGGLLANRRRKPSVVRGRDHYRLR